MFNSLKPGQELNFCVGRMTPEDKSTLQTLKLTRNNHVYVTFVDGTGVSVYIKRYEGDIHGFIPAGGVGFINWSTFFEPLDHINYYYAGSKHVSKVFPKDFL